MRQINTASQIKPTVLQEQAKQLKKITPVRLASPTPVRRAPVNRTQKKQNKKKGKSRRKPRKR
jgi:hypothetical protein